MLFGEVVRDWRRRLGITQEELADRSGLSVRSIRDIETNRVRAPRPATMRLLAETLGLPETPTSILPVPEQLPPNVPAFTGRTDHIARLDALRAGGGPTSVVIAGTAGVGKTSLAVYWAHRVKAEFPDGQLYVNLRGFDPTGSVLSPEEAVRGFLDAFGDPPRRIPTGLDAQVELYRDLLAGRRVLVVLDNARDADQIRPLLPDSPGCLALVTSRSELPADHTLSLDLLTAGEARQLLARRVGPDKVATEPDAADEIISRCARLPLALVIVAARTATHPELSLAKLAAELGDARHGLEAFAGTDAATDVRSVFSWSYHTLDAAAARLFRLLSVHPGPDIGVEAAASLAATSADRVRPVLDDLARAHLVASPTPGRYAFHDLLRAYATELTRSLDPEAERRAVLRRMLDHYLHSASAVALRLHPRRDPIALVPPAPEVMPELPDSYEEAQDWFLTERLVLLAAIEQAAGSGFDAHAWQLAWTLITFLDRQGHWRELAATQRTAVDAAHRVGDRIGQAQSHRALARAHSRRGREAEALGQYRQALALFTALGDRAGQATTHRYLCSVLERQGRLAESLGHAEQALALYRAAGHRAGQADALNDVGWCLALRSDYRPALVYAEQALALHRETGNRLGEAATWATLGYAHHHLGDHRQATACYQRALGEYRELGDPDGEAEALHRLGDTHQAAGDPGAAREAWRQALEILDELGHLDAGQVRAKLGRQGHGNH